MVKKQDLTNSQTPSDEQKSDQGEGENNQSLMRKFGLFSVIVFDLLGYTGAGVGIGYWAWTRWGFPWWILLITTFAGLGMAFYQLYRISEREL
jgi:hypothetical protein